MDGQNNPEQVDVEENSHNDDDVDDIDDIDVENITSDQNLQLKYNEPSHFTSYSIPQGVIMYHASKTVRTFDTTKINVGSNNFTAFFTPDFDVAMSMINGCYFTGENSKELGFVHKFIVKREIDKIIIISPHDKDLNWTEKYLNENYCNSEKFTYRPNGIGFFIDTSTTKNFNVDIKKLESKIYQSQFAFCNPSAFLQYEGTYSCVASGILSKNLISFETNEIVQD